MIEGPVRIGDLIIYNGSSRAKFGEVVGVDPSSHYLTLKWQAISTSNGGTRPIESFTSTLPWPNKFLGILPSYKPI